MIKDDMTPMQNWCNRLQIYIFIYNIVVKEPVIRDDDE